MGAAAPDILRVEGLVKHFPVAQGVVHAADGVSFAVARGETLALVGESGSGKSTVARAILRLVEPTAGRVWFSGVDVTNLGGRALRALRQQMQIIFQDPYGSLNPLMTVEAILREPFIIHRVGTRAEQAERVDRLMIRVGLDPAMRTRYSREFSGGQRHRIAIARALALEPSFLICDEPVSALDVSIQAQILNLLDDLQDDLGLTYLFISHDLSVVRQIADRVAVMYLGKIVELAPRDAFYARPRHPYTLSLLSAVPLPDPRRERSRRRIILAGDVPNPMNPPSGCRFRTRCWKAREVCAATEPPLVEQEPGHWVACHFPE